MQFAARTDFEAGDAAYAEALRHARAGGGLLDLTVSNPTRCGFAADPDLLQPLLEVEALQYDPDPLGMRCARESVADRYRSQGCAGVTLENIVLTASTSEAYGYLLRLLCEPGDAILVPSPSYPLFDLLARLHDVALIPYPLVYHDGWQIDPASLHAAVTGRTRAIVAIHPNNPTGHYCNRTDREALLQCANRFDLPLIVDEVFLEYPVEAAPAPSFTALDEMEPQAGDAPLLFVLGGLSKLVCLPQMKLAWLLACGPQQQTHEAINRLEVIADTFLSVGTPPQLALPKWLEHGGRIRAEVLARVAANLSWLDAVLSGTVVSRLRVEAGWTVVLRVPAVEADLALVTRLLQVSQVAVHPGSFYGFGHRGWLVLSLITPRELFRQGIQRLLEAFASQ